MGLCCSTPIEEPPLEETVEEDATGGLSEAYDVKHLLGSGSAGDAWLCQERATGDLVAVKLIKRPIPPLMGTSIMREVKIGAELGKGHLNIVKPREVVLTRTHLGLVMEYVAGGNMADYILKSILLKFGQFDRRDGLVMDEDEALYFFKQVINAVAYCHQRRVAHRDLKMDNTLLDDSDPPRIKLCDFGFARNWAGPAPQMTTITGTPDYMSPQLLGAKIGAPSMQALYDGTKADIWAAGVMLCVMLIGRFPFEGTQMSHVTDLNDVSEHVWTQQTQGTHPWHDNPLIARDCGMLSYDCIDLLNRIFELDESKRITIDGIRSHVWFNRTLPPLYQRALDKLAAEQARIDAAVAAGAFVSRDRDSALKTMIYLAASRYDPDAEAGHTLGGAKGVQTSSSLLRKISLTALRPGQYDQVTAGRGHTDLATISKFFRDNAPDGGGGGNGSGTDGGGGNGGGGNGDSVARAESSGNDGGGGAARAAEATTTISSGGGGGGGAAVAPGASTAAVAALLADAAKAAKDFEAATRAPRPPPTPAPVEAAAATAAGKPAAAARAPPPQLAPPQLP